ncbi:MAG: alpha/beta hydrolase family protein [Candidatus Levyibacteriota bacterium]
MEIIKTTSFELATISAGDKNSGRFALVLPGRLDTKDYEVFRKHIDFLATLGFYALSFDPPGTWESPGDTSLFTTTNYIKAVDELIAYFGNRPTFLMGHSRGASISILAGAKNPHVFACAPIMATLSGEPRKTDPEAARVGFKMAYRDMPPGTEKTAGQKEFKLPLNYFIDMEKYDVVEALKNCTKPKLLIYGTEDEFTTPERVKEVFELIPEPKELFKLTVNHDYRYHPDMIEKANQAIGKFLRVAGSR